MEGISLLTDDAILYVVQHLDTHEKINFAYTSERFRQICINHRAFRKLDLSERPILIMQQSAIKEFFRDKQMAQHIRELNLNNLRVLNWKMDDHLQEFIMSICPHLEALHVLNCGMSFLTLHRILQQAPKLRALSWSLLDLKPGQDVKFLTNCMKSSDDMYLKNIKHLHLEIFDSEPNLQILKKLKHLDRIQFQECAVFAKHNENQVETTKANLLTFVQNCKNITELDVRGCVRDHEEFSSCSSDDDLLALSHCKYVEELEIYAWKQTETFWSKLDLDFDMHSENLTFLPQPSTSISNALPHLHSLMMVAFGVPQYSNSLHTSEISDFVFSNAGKKSHETNWKKIWIAPEVPRDIVRDMFNLTASSVPLFRKHPYEYRSVEAFSACLGPSLDAGDDFKTLFQKIDDDSIKNLHVSVPSSQSNLIPKICKPILRTGGRALKFLSLFVDRTNFIDTEAKLFFNTLFSGCLNIKDLDLLRCHFEDNICEALSKLKHLDRIQFQECAVFAKHNENQVETTKANLLTFVQNCKNITELDVRGCVRDHEEFSSCSSDDDLLALTKLTKLRSLTLHEVSGIKQWTFLRNISENCKCLTMLRIWAIKCFNKSCIPIILESAKFLKHLAITVREIDLGLTDYWKLLSHATNLERLCISSIYMGSPNVSSALEMLKRLPRLHVLHLHTHKFESVKSFCAEISRTLKEESDSSFRFELVGHNYGGPHIVWLSTKPLPLNATELCHRKPILVVPTL